MIAGIAHLRGYDLADPRVRNAILVCLLDEDIVSRLVKKKQLPAPPMALATAPAHDPELDQVVSAVVASELITRMAGKRLATTVGRRIPVVGGVVGGERRRLLHLAGRALRRPRAPAARRAVDPQREPSRPAVLQPAHGLLAPAVGRPQVGALEVAVGVVEPAGGGRARGGPAARSRPAAR